MATKRALKCGLLVLLAIGSAGCWDAIDINDRDIVTAVVLDKTDYGYAFTLEVQSITGGAKQGTVDTQQASMKILSSEGRTLSEAREDIDRRSDKPIYLGAVQSLIVTDKMASYGIEEYLMRVRQLNEYRNTVHVVVTDNTPEELLSIKPENAPSVGFSIDTTIMTLVNNGELPHIRLMDILEVMESTYPRFVLPTVSVVKDEPTFTGFTVFSGGMKTGFIPASESKSIVFMNAKNPKFNYTVPYKDTYSTVQVILSGKKITPRFTDGAASFDMSLKFKTLMLYPEKMKTITNSDLELIRATLRAILEQDFMQTFYKSQQEYQYDVFDLHEHFRVAYPEEFKRMNWADEYQKVKISLSIDVNTAVSQISDYNPNDE